MTREKGNSVIELLDDYTVIDIETTGLCFGLDEIIEFGAIKVREGKEVDRFNFLVKPKNFNLFDPEFTGISTKDLKAAFPIEQVLPEFVSFIGDDTLVGANINSFDINFIYDNVMSIMNKKLSNNMVDIFRFARKLLPDMNKYSLQTIGDKLGFSDNYHRAINDCVVTFKCYEWFKDYIERNNIDLVSLFKKKKTNHKVSDIQVTVDCIKDNLFKDKTIVITGKLPEVTRKEALQIIKNMGGAPRDNYVNDIDILVVGTLKENEIEKGTEKIKKVRNARLSGKDIKIIDGQTFTDYYKEYFKGLNNE